MGRKRRAEQLEMAAQQQQQHQLGNYLLQSSAAGAMPAAASHASVPANFWMVANSGNQVISGDPIWTFPQMNNASALYRGTMSSGLHFMNFPTPVALLPGQQLGAGIGSSGGSGSGGGGGSSSGGGGGGISEGQFGLFAGLNPYRQTSISNSQPSGSHSHHGGDDRHDSASHHS